MTSAQYFLPPAEEGKYQLLSHITTLTCSDALHRDRILNNEKKAFDRITNRLLGMNSILAPVQRPKPPSAEEPTGRLAKKKDVDKDDKSQDIASFKKDFLLDFASFEASIIRTQLLLNSNEQERERYAAEKIRIQASTQDVRDSTSRLRLQLEDAKKQLALRKTYDELADKITSNRLLKPRKDQYANLEKLNHEIAELERESSDYAQTWAVRRAQFGKIIEEGKLLQRIIQEEKAEVERREGMESREDGDDADVASRGRSSAVGTPGPEGREATPQLSNHDGANTSLSVHQALNAREKSPLGRSTPRLEVTTPQAEEPDDIDMAEDGEVSGDEDNAGDEVESEGLVAEYRVDEDDEKETHEAHTGDSMDTS